MSQGLSFVHLREEMVNQQLLARGIVRQGIINAFYSIPRERFVGEEYQVEAYSDSPLPIGYGQTISQPYVVGLMLAVLECGEGMRVLDVGSGSGYQAALLSMLCDEVFGIERQAELAERALAVIESLDIENVTIVVGDGSAGLRACGPYDRIICGAAVPEIPWPWVEQLVEGGRVVAPVGDMQEQQIVVADKRNGEIVRKTLDSVRFVKLTGEYGFQCTDC